MSDTITVNCEGCGKKLIERKPNGVWRFRFGSVKGSNEPAIDIEIQGSVKIKCFRKNCRAVNVLNYFP